jgi:SAM-dependent methyltransferase
MPISSDRDSVNEQYKSDKDLSMRQSVHDLYTVPKINFIEWVLNTVHWNGQRVVADVGCATGIYYDELLRLQPDVQYVGFDLSHGMLTKHHGDQLAVADAVQLPLADGSVDVVMANHMLYHVEDYNAALIEFKRVLKTNGTLIVASNSVQNMPEIQVLMRRAILLLARGSATTIHPPAPSSNSFALENGTRYLARHFYAVMRVDLPSKLIFHEAKPLLDYIESTRSLREAQLPEGVLWDDMMMVMAQQVDHLINHLGELVINKLTGVLVATDHGDFIQEFDKIKSSLS